MQRFPVSKRLFAAVALFTTFAASMAEAHHSKRSARKSVPPIETARIDVDDPQPGQIYVSLADRRLYRLIWDDFAYSFPIGAPRKVAEWEGRYPVSRKQKHPVWAPTPRMRRSDPGLPRFIRGGSRKNPLGTRAIYLGDSMYRVHGTNKPRSIGRSASSGCIRMLNPHVEQLFAMTEVGVEVIVVKKSLVRGAPAAAAGAPQPIPVRERFGDYIDALWPVADAPAQVR